MFSFDSARILSWLTLGFGDGLNLKLRRAVHGESVHAIGKPRLDVVAEVTRAIYKSSAVEVSYLSLTSGASERELVPHALVDNGIRWHVRAFDRASQRFSDFVVSRMTSAKQVVGDPADEELRRADAQWARIVDLELVPHPGLKHPDAIQADYGMNDGVLRAQIRAAVVGYALRRWQVDCSSDHSLDPNEHHLWLRDTPTLYGVESAAMGPGYRQQGA
ncbi:WYL domain-containing protein [Cupriavidus sp. SK-3]|uniref:WYL domain-containing protein n=1 Tax=Cupriavidus sp. SK-3 TaxID=1470558 RepID=UPI0026ACD0F7